LGNTRPKHNQLPAVIWNFYYDAKKLVQANNCNIITTGVREGILLGGAEKIALKITICPKNEQFALKPTF